MILYGDAANFQNEGAYELAVEEWEKFLTKFPDDPLAPKAQHYLGVCNLQLKRFQKAADAFAVVIAKYPNNENIQDAYLNLGWCHHSLAGQNDEGMHAKAAATFSEMVKKFPEGKYTDQALFFWGESEYKQGNKKQAAAAYDQLVKGHSQSKLRTDAIYALGVTYEELEQYPDAGRAYDLFLKECAESELVTEVRMRKAETILQAGDFAAAEKMFGEVAGVEGFASVDHAIFRRAYCLAKLDKFAEAGALYAKIPTDHKQSVYVSESTISVGRCYYRAGRLDDAAKWLQSAVDAADQFAPEAAHWLSRIHLKQNEPQKVLPLTEKALAGAADSQYAVNLRMDRADALHEIEDSKPQALDLYLKIAADHAQHELAPQALYSAAFEAMELGKHDEGLKHCDAFHTAYSDDELLPDVDYVVAECCYKLGQYPSAEIAYRDLISKYENHEALDFWRLGLARCLYLQRKHQDVIMILESAVSKLEEARGIAEAQFLLAASHCQLKDYGLAVDALEASYEAYPRLREIDEEGTQLLPPADAKRLADFNWDIGVAYYFYLAGRPQEAVTVLDPLVPGLEAADDVALAQFLIGKSQFLVKAYDPAAQALQASLQASPQWRQADETMIYLSRALREQDNVAEAIKTIAKVISDFSESQYLDRAHYRHGEYSCAAEDYETAATHYEKVVTQWPDSAFAAYAQYGKGWSQLKSKKYNEAAETFTALITNHAEHKLVPNAHFARGMCRRQTGQFDEAIKEINTYLQSEPDLANKLDALYERGLAEVALEKHTVAATTFLQLLRENPQYANADKVLYELAWAYKSTGDDSKQADAVVAFAKLATHFPDSPLAAEANFHVGESHYEKREFDAAAKAYTAARDKKPSKDLGEKAVYKLGWSHFQLKGYDAALADFVGQLEDYPQGPLHADALFMKAECLFGLKKYEEALPVYTATQDVELASATSTVLALLHGGQCASQTKQWDQALAFMSQIPEKHADSAYLPETYYELGWAKQKAGKEDEAMKDYERAASGSRRAVGARARFMIGELYFSQKKHNEAIPQFQRVMFGYGGDNAPADVKKWQAKAAYEAARCSEVQVKEARPADREKLIADAKKYYQYVLERHPQEELVATAKERHGILDRLVPDGDLARVAESRPPLIANIEDLGETIPSGSSTARPAQTDLPSGTEAGRNFAFLVAVADYDLKHLKPLQYSRNDILEFHAELIKSGFDKGNVVLMHDDLKQVKHRRYLPEANKIVAELNLLLATVREMDTLVVALAGHGVQFKGQRTNYFCPVDADLDNRDSLISLRDLYNKLEACPARRKLLLVDACRDDPQSRISRSRETVQLESVTRPQTEPVPEGIVALFSCSAGQRSYEWPDLGHGVFFYHLLESWRGAADKDKDGNLTLNEFVEFTQGKTESFVRDPVGAIQTPQCVGQFTRHTGAWVLRKLRD